MEYTIRVELDEDAKRALDAEETRSLSKQLAALERKVERLEQMVQQVLLAPDEYNRSIRAGYGE